MKGKNHIVFLCVTLCLMVGLLSFPVSASAVNEPYAVTVRIGTSDYRVRAYEGSYEGNTYLSLTDLASALAGTPKQ